MRLSQLLDSDYAEDLQAEVITLLTAISAEGIDEVDTQNLLIDLEAQGYPVDEQSLLELLDGLPIVATASLDKIQISTSDVDMMVGGDDEEISANRVDDLATKQSTDDIGSDINDSVDRMRQLAGIRGI